MTRGNDFNGKHDGWEFSGLNIVWILYYIRRNFLDWSNPGRTFLNGIFLGGNFLGRSYLVWEFSWWELSLVGIFLVGIVQVGVILGGNSPRWEFSGWELSGRNHPGGVAVVYTATDTNVIIIRHQTSQIMWLSSVIG